MANNAVKKALRECHRQLDVLYVYFGKLLYENAEKENLYYCFGAKGRHLEEKAQVFLQKMKFAGQEQQECGQQGKHDPAFFECVSKKLRDETVSREDKLHLLNEVLCSPGDGVVHFLFELIKEADLFSKKQLIKLLKEVKSTVLADLYREFINADDSFLRLHGIMGLRSLEPEQAKEFIISAACDPDPHIRRFVVNYLDCSGGDNEAAAITRLANDNDQAVARVAVRKLGKLKEMPDLTG